MSSMTGPALEEALKHDLANKAALAGEAPEATQDSTVEIDGTMQEIDTSLVIGGLEDKQALLAKTTALALIQICHQYVDAAMTKTFPVDDGGNVRKVTHSVDAKQGAVLLELAGKALELAGKADMLADRAIVRRQPKDVKGPA